MSILIHGMEMPQDCDSCVFCENEMFQKYCPLSDNYYDWGESSTGNRPSDCPLVPLPEGHGRLGDLDALEAKFREEALEHTLIGDLNRMTLGVGEVIDRIRMADTIVPAEGGTDECSEN